MRSLRAAMNYMQTRTYFLLNRVCILLWSKTFEFCGHITQEICSSDFVSRLHPINRDVVAVRQLPGADTCRQKIIRTCEQDVMRHTLLLFQAKSFLPKRYITQHAAPKKLRRTRFAAGGLFDNR